MRLGLTPLIKNSPSASSGLLLTYFSRLSPGTLLIPRVEGVYHLRYIRPRGGGIIVVIAYIYTEYYTFLFCTYPPRFSSIYPLSIPPTVCCM